MVEVGVDVPNATVVVQSAERFGLARSIIARGRAGGAS